MSHLVKVRFPVFFIRRPKFTDFAEPCYKKSSVALCFFSPDTVRLVNGNSLCSGRLEVKSNQRWSSVCEDDFDQQDAEVVCRELGCGAPSDFKGGLHGDCGGHESAPLDCRSSVENTCSPGKAVGLTCSGRRGATTLILFSSWFQVTSLHSLIIHLSLFRPCWCQVGGRNQPLQW